MLDSVAGHLRLSLPKCTEIIFKSISCIVFSPLIWKVKFGKFCVDEILYKLQPFAYKKIKYLWEISFLFQSLEITTFLQIRE